MKNPSKVVKDGDQWKAVVLEVHSQGRTLVGLTSRTNLEIQSKALQVGRWYEGRVRNMTILAIHLNLRKASEGLVCLLSDLSWTKRVKHPS